MKYRSRGGDSKALANRITGCRFHHLRGEHGDVASVRGEAPLGLVWRLGHRDMRATHTWYRNERRLRNA